MSNQQKCSNCSHVFTCSCQKRTATDGKLVCSLCVQAYEAQLAANKAKSQ